MEFELTDRERDCLGLARIAPQWERVEIAPGCYLYFEGNVIRKAVDVTDATYHEREMNEVTDDARGLLLPKTARGRAKKLTVAAMRAREGSGMYFHYDGNGAQIASYAAQTTYFTCLGDGNAYNGLGELRKWLDEWVADTAEEDLADIARFRDAGRRHIKYREGDFFAFKIGRREYGFGRILMDVKKFKKSEASNGRNHYGLNFMGAPLIVKVYRKISQTPCADLDALSGCGAFPSQQIMDNVFYFGECQIIGNRALAPQELDFPISYGRSIDLSDRNTVYLQYGRIYKETDVSKYDKYLTLDEAGNNRRWAAANPYRNGGIGFQLDVLRDISTMKTCVAQDSNDAWWANAKVHCVKLDLRNPALYPVKQDIFSFFGLRAGKSYAENLEG